MIKLVAIDLDGTLLDGNKKISRRNKEVIRQAKEKGIKIVLCTGRPLKGMSYLLEELDLLDAGDYSITFNGGLVQKNDTGEVIDQATLTKAQVHQVYELAKELDLPLDAISNDTMILLNPSKSHLSIYPEISPLLNRETARIDELEENRSYNKVVVAYEQGYLDEQIKKIPVSFRQTFEVVKTRANLLEFMPKGVTKAYGLALLADELKIPQSQVMAIGDEENDLPMIEYAALGIAMENAVSFVKEAADIITDSNEEDGVAKAIERYVFTSQPSDEC